MLTNELDDFLTPRLRSKYKLDSLGKEYEWYVEPYEGHGFRGEQSRLNMYGKVEEFLAKHLN